MKRPAIQQCCFILVGVLLSVVMLTWVPVCVQAEENGLTPIYQSLSELTGKRIAYVNGSVYDKKLEAKVEGTTAEFYPSLSDCVAAVEAGKEDAAVQISYCCELVVNRRGGTVTVLPETVDPIEEAFFFPKGDPLTEQFNSAIKEFEADGTIDELRQKWVSTDESVKTLPEQDWDAPHGTLKFATSGVLEPFSYVGEGGEALGYDVDLALRIAKKLGYHLDVSTIAMDAIFASVQSGKVDFGGTLTNTVERAKVVDFSLAVMPCSVAVIVKAEGNGAADMSLGGFFQTCKTLFERTFIDENRWQLILGGLGTTVLISVCAGFLGTLLGFGLVLIRRSTIGWLNVVVNGYQALMGGIPLVVILMVLYYVVFGAFDISGTVVAIVAFALSFGSVAGTTMWTSVSGIGTIQEESGLALGFTRDEVFRTIIFPQAAQRFLPQLMGQFVSLVKDTAIVGYIAVQDLTRASDLIRARTMDAFFPLISTAVIYFLFCRLLAWLLDKLARRLDAGSRPNKIEGIDS